MWGGERSYFGHKVKPMALDMHRCAHNKVAPLCIAFKVHSARFAYEELQIARNTVMGKRNELSAGALPKADAIGKHLKGDHQDENRFSA